MVNYKTFQSVLSTPDTTNYITFGITGVDEHNNTIIRVPNIFLSLESAESFAETLNRHNVSPIHIFEIIEDML